MKRPVCNTKCWLSALAGTIVILVASIYFGWSHLDWNPERGLAEAELPRITPSSFRNTSPEARYVGSDACTDCHTDEHESYLATTHSRALASIDLAAVPDDTEYFHAVSGRWYRVYRQDGQLRHCEYIKTRDDQEVILNDHQIDYVLGSGNHSQTYLLEVDGFLMESPIHWFTAPNKWDMSPGYEDNPDHPAFSRPVRTKCVFCHVGHSEPIDSSIHRLKIHDLTIGCERCHGPGSLHVELHESGGEIPSGGDNTIVNPVHLERAQQESICAQCHLGGAALVSLRGRNIGQYRPGLNLSDFAISYVTETENEAMTVVGHSEQMKLSRCYSESESLTCTTCHEPHNPLAKEARPAFYRDTCLSCHSACGREGAELTAAQDDCTTCHMPRSDTDIPHTVFTHHRIGLYASDAFLQPDHELTEVVTPIPLEDTSHLPEIDQQRNLGLAYLQLATSAPNRDLGQTYLRRSFEILRELAEQGLNDPEIHVALAFAYSQIDPIRSAHHATVALRAEKIWPDNRRDALTFLASSQFKRRQADNAIETLEQLVMLERRFENWMMLAICYQEKGDLPAALRAAEKAVGIRPDLPHLHSLVADLCQQMGDQPRASEQRRLAAQLQESKQTNK